MISIIVLVVFMMLCEGEPNRRDRNWKIIMVVMMLFWLVEMLFSCSY